MIFAEPVVEEPGVTDGDLYSPRAVLILVPVNPLRHQRTCKYYRQAGPVAGHARKLHAIASGCGINARGREDIGLGSKHPHRACVLLKHRESPYGEGFPLQSDRACMLPTVSSD